MQGQVDLCGWVHSLPVRGQVNYVYQIVATTPRTHQSVQWQLEPSKTGGAMLQSPSRQPTSSRAHIFRVIGKLKLKQKISVKISIRSLKIFLKIHGIYTTVRHENFTMHLQAIVAVQAHFDSQAFRPTIILFIVIIFCSMPKLRNAPLLQHRMATESVAQQIA